MPPAIAARRTSARKLSRARQRRARSRLETLAAQAFSTYDSSWSDLVRRIERGQAIYGRCL